MTASKKLLQRLGSWVVRQVSGTKVPDTTSGFRAYTRDAALRMTIVSEFSYTLESIIQAGKRRMAIAHVEVRTNARTRESRLFDSMFAYIKRSAATIVRIYASYEPLKVFSYIGGTIFGVGFADVAALRLLLLTGTGDGKLQSLILSAVLMIVGFQVVLIGLVADLISGSRKVLEDVLYRVRVLELDSPARPAGDDRPLDAAAGRTRSLMPVADPASTSIVIPAFNEGAVVGDVVARCARAGAWHEIIVVDDGSTDDTGDACRGRRRARRAAPLQQGQRRLGEERHPRRDRRVRAHPRRRRAAQSRRRVPAGVDSLGDYDLVVGARTRRPRRRAPGASATPCSTGSPAISRAGPFPT